MNWDSEVAQLAGDVIEGLTSQTPVTVTKVTPGTFNKVTGTRTSTTSTASVRAVRGPANVAVVGEGKTRVEYVRFDIRASDLNFIPDADDTITCDTLVYRVSRVARICDGTFYAIETSRTVSTP